MTFIKDKHFNIPIFIPEMACAYQCIYCNQKTITGIHNIPSEEDVQNIIEKHLKTINAHINDIEIAFFGGNFTGIHPTVQKQLLQKASRYVDEGKVRGIRISTRPDYINNKILDLLKENKVSTIELGVQSMDDHVLKLSGRGYTSSDVKKAAALIIDAGFDLGMQMIIGLPGDNSEKALKTAGSIIDCKAKMTRIYPLLVIKDTILEELYRKNEYIPLSIEEAVDLCKKLYTKFFNSNVHVLKMGLHPSESLTCEGNIIAGPYHKSFAELVFTDIWKEVFSNLLPDKKSAIEIFVNPSDYNHAIGYKGVNKILLLEKFKRVKFNTEVHLPKHKYNVVYC